MCTSENILKFEFSDVNMAEKMKLLVVYFVGCTGYKNIWKYNQRKVHFFLLFIQVGFDSTKEVPWSLW